MPPLSLLHVQPEGRLEFPSKATSASCVRLRLSNTSGTLVAYKVKSTAPKNYSIKPSTGSIRKGETADVQIVRRPPEEGDGPENSNGRRQDRFLLQAAIVDTDQKKLLLHAAHRGKAQGAAKFWEEVPKDILEEQTLEAVFVEDCTSANYVEFTEEGDAASGPQGKKQVLAPPKSRTGPLSCLLLDQSGRVCLAPRMLMRSLASCRFLEGVRQLATQRVQLVPDHHRLASALLAALWRPQIPAIQWKR